MADDKAKVKIDVEGAPEAERKLKKVRDGFKDWGRELGGIVSGMVRDIGSVSTSLARVDPGTAAQKFRDYRRTVTEWSIASQRSVADVKQSFAGLADRTLLPDEDIAGFSQSLAKATYDVGDSTKAIEALRGEGVATGRSLEDMGAIAETLHNSMGTSLADIPVMLGNIEGAANALGTVGGPAALIDDITALGGILSQVSVRGKHDAQDLIATLAAIGKGLRPEQQRNVQAALVSRFTQGGEQMRLNLGIRRDAFYDEHGNVRVTPQNVQRLRDFYLKRTGGNVEKAQSLAAFSGNLGPQLAAALFRPDLMADIKKGATVAPGGAAQAALDKLAGTDHGRETKAQIDRERNTREGMGATVNDAQQAAAAAMPDNAWARMIGMGVGGGLAGKAVDTALGALGREAGYAASKMFAVGEAGGKAQLVLQGLGSSAVGGGGAPVVAAAAGGAVVAGAGVTAAGLAAAKTEAAIRDGLYDAMAKQRSEQKAKQDAGQDPLYNDLMAGRKKMVGTWYGGTKYEDVPKEQQAAQAAEYQKLVGKAPPVEVHVQITDASSHPNQVVQVQKGSAGQQ